MNEPIKTMSRDQDQLFEAAENGDAESLGQLMNEHFEKLSRIVGFRMDRRLQGRLDASDVVQETFVEATRRFEYYCQNKKAPFFMWLRFLALQKLAEIHRHHLGTKIRDQRREVSIFKKSQADATSANIAAALVGEQTSPSEAFSRNQAISKMATALTKMDPVDQEVVALRHFEQLSNVEVALTLGLTTSAASKRFLRAIKRLKAIVAEYDPEDER